ncbi:MAG: hypothetical protein A2075_12015 [Geobacteraceae bacterium GWC2_58_44]|nr:MAG: hypothetical protein A2075_12015 [Geobacteraceae bacterium GWC2_58_44]HBG06288.1 hypothetical protein [Geobacter sp.]
MSSELNLKKRLLEIIGEEEPYKWAARAGVSKSTLYNILNKDGNPRADQLLKLSKATGRTMEWLLTGSSGELAEELQGVSERVDQYEPTTVDKVKVYALAGAGHPNELTDTTPVAEVAVPKGYYKPSIVPVLIRGRSMEDTIVDGAIVGVDREDKMVVSGEIYAVWVPYEGAVVKRLYLDPEKITCRSDNSKFADFVVMLDRVDEHFVLGRVKWVIQRY